MRGEVSEGRVRRDSGRGEAGVAEERFRRACREGEGQWGEGEGGRREKRDREGGGYTGQIKWFFKAVVPI